MRELLVMWWLKMVVHYVVSRALVSENPNVEVRLALGSVVVVNSGWWCWSDGHYCGRVGWVAAVNRYPTWLSVDG